jgi:hypothetical protein
VWMWMTLEPPFISRHDSELNTISSRDFNLEQISNFISASTSLVKHEIVTQRYTQIHL